MHFALDTFCDITDNANASMIVHDSVYVCLKEVKGGVWDEKGRRRM